MQVPFNKNNGNLEPYPSSYNTEWLEDPPPFKAMMTINSMERGRSAAHFIGVDYITGKRYTIFMVDLLDIIRRVGIEAGGVVHGNWEFCKRGSNYAIRLVK